MNSPLNEVADDPRILQASRDYLTELEAGRRPDRESYLRRYPDLAEAISECLDGIELAHSLRPVTVVALPEFSAAPIGDFQILYEIGRGGMGTVYEAIQLSLGRRIALKVLPFAAALDAKQLQLFKNEAHAAAQLHHTNIVPVYAVGCERGVHFYAMQLIQGRSLSAVIQELRGNVSDQPGNPWSMATTVNQQPNATIASSTLKPSQVTGHDRESLRSAARIGAQVADALEYAHEAGVVHRDIKPANLLMDSKGAMWVTDFGLAQISADAGVTQTGDLVGTLRYMSPEQASGRRVPVDHRADVYSLGATLYELLTLQPIFAGNDRVSLLHQIFNEDPRPPRQLNRAIPFELETIVLKATAKNPTERYSTAGDMAADLRRFLEERPILARRPTIVDQVRKWMRRHPAFVRAALVLLVCGTVGLAISRSMIAHEQAETKAAYQREALRASEAEARFEMARRAADEMIRLAEEELSDNPFEEGLRKQLLESALQYYQEFISLKDGKPESQHELSLTRDRVQKILADLAVLQADRNNILLGEPAVRDDLQLTAAQRTQLDEMPHLNDQRRLMFRQQRKSTTNEHRQRSLDIARENEVTLAGILSPVQLRRLAQIALQCQGPRAFRQPDVSSQLKLTAEQRELVRQHENEMMLRMVEFHRGPPPEEEIAKVVEAGMKQMLSVLTPTQLETWHQMTGETYRGPNVFTSRFSPPPGGPHGRPEDRPRNRGRPPFPQGPPGPRL